MHRGLVLTTVGVGALCGAALGQNALDRPLDRNPQIGSGGFNPGRPDFAQEMRLRNAIVTGNAPAGFSLRADVGYRAPGEFFGHLGTNDQFAYRRDSYYSGLGGMGIRGTDALQYQFAMTTGNTPPPGFAGSVAIPRSGASTRVEALRSDGEMPSVAGITRAVADPDKPGADLRGISMMSLRSPSSFMSMRGLEATRVGLLTSSDGKAIGVSASPLRGIAYDTLNEPAKPLRDGITPPIEQRGLEKSDPGKLSERSNTKEDPKVQSTAGIGKTAYEDLMDRLKAGGDKPETPGETKDPGKLAAASNWQTQLEELRKQLRESVERPPVKPADPGTPKPDAEKPETPAPDTTPTVERIRKAGTEVERLAPPGFDAYAAHMQAAQEHLKVGGFFNAEERFTAALGLKSGDPMAAIGRVHAQLGAGMFLSASVNLRTLFVEHPEVVSLKYKPELMPSRERLRTLVDRLTELSNAKDGKRRDHGLLLGYIGFQTGDQIVMKRGLDLMAEAPEAAPGEKPPAGPDQLQKLATLLTKVWIAPTAPAPKPEAPPANPPPIPAEPNK